MPPLELKDAVTVITGIVTLSGVIYTMRASVAKLESGQTEVLRQLGALHKRMDHFSERLNKSEIQHARLEERVSGLRESQRFRLRVEPAPLSEADEG